MTTKLVPGHVPDTTKGAFFRSEGWVFLQIGALLAATIGALALASALLSR
ncbi:hypothetical protein [Subtercola boreus]|nr:hypothetical protein [Subtercola boreus]